MSRIFYLMGKSASGKDTLYRILGERMPFLKPVTLYTTRPMREGERNGVDYFFVDEQQCLQWQRSGKVIELRAYETAHGVWKYFTVMDEQLCGDTSHRRMIGTLESYMAMRSRFGDRLVPIYIEVEDGLRLYRALSREREQESPKYEELCRRFLADSEDFSEENLCKAGISYRFNNESLEKCAADIEQFVRAMV